MDILKTAECSPLNPGETIFTIVVFSRNDETYIGRFNGRCTSGINIDLGELENVVKLDKTAYQPDCSEHFTRAKHIDKCFVKRPSLLSYHPINDTNKKRIAEEILREIEVCEMFKVEPHPNIAEYIGCEVTDGKISGICFKQYKNSLQQRLNPGHLNKRAFTRSICLDEAWCSGIIQGNRSGLDHLHALGFVHNDITPSNIMLDEHDTPIIIDFGSCRANGESLEDVGRTYEWYDHEVKTARPSNDLDPLAEMEVWMFGKADDFQFAEMTV